MFVQQKTKFPIKSLKTTKGTIHNKLFPNTIRALVCGPSGCGKTVLMYNLIVQKEGLKFTNLYIISNSLEQEKYRRLKEIFDKVPEVKLHTMTEVPQQVEIGSVVVFDDIIDPNIEPYFSMGRHRKLNCFYLCQTYSKIPKQLIRDNANFIIVFQQDDLNLKHIFNNHVGSDFTFQEFKDLCNLCWQEKYGFLVIDKERLKNKGKYRCKIDKFYTDLH
jgi:hypothetical protein